MADQFQARGDDSMQSSEHSHISAYANEDGEYVVNTHGVQVIIGNPIVEFQSEDSCASEAPLQTEGLLPFGSRNTDNYHDTPFAYNIHKLDPLVTKIQAIYSTPNFNRYPITFKCLSEMYHMQQLRTQGQASRQRLQRLHEAVQFGNPVISEQFSVLRRCTAILNFLIDHWHVFESLQFDMSYRESPELCSIALIDVSSLKQESVSLEILWLSTVNSPGRYIANSIKEQIEPLQAQFMKVVDVIIRLCLLPRVDGRVFQRKCGDLFRLTTAARGRQSLLACIQAFLKVYISFEQACLSAIYRLNSLAYMKHMDGKGRLEDNTSYRSEDDFGLIK